LPQTQSLVVRLASTLPNDASWRLIYVDNLSGSVKLALTLDEKHLLLTSTARTTRVPTALRFQKSELQFGNSMALYYGPVMATISWMGRKCDP